MAESRWNPWRELPRHNEIELYLTPLPPALGGAICIPDGDSWIILIDPSVRGSERRAALTHEMVHVERGGGIDAPGMPAAWATVVTREEAIVNRMVAQRLVPPALLAAFVASQGSIGEGVSARDVALEFDVPEWVARDALRALPGGST